MTTTASLPARIDAITSRWPSRKSSKPKCWRSEATASDTEFMCEVYQFVQIRGKEVVLRGLGGPSAKSARLFWVFAQPFAARTSAFVLLGARAGVEPRKQFAVLPYPRRSAMFGSFGQVPVMAV